MQVKHKVCFPVKIMPALFSFGIRLWWAKVLSEIDMASLERDEFGNVVGDTKYWNPFAAGIAPQVPEPRGFDNDGVYGDPRRMAQELNFDPATGEYTPLGYNGGPLASGIFGATPTPPDMSLLSPTTGVNGGTILNPVAVDPGQSTPQAFPLPGSQPRVGAFEPPPIPGGQRSFSYPNVERDASVPSWMVNNPDFDPRSPSQSGMQEYTNPATGETYMGGTSSNNQYMVDPSLQGEFTTPPNRGGSLMRSNGSEFSGIFGASPTPTPSPDIGLPTLAPVSSTPAPSASQPTPYTQDFDSMHREQHSQMGGGITSVAPSDNFTRPTWSGSPGPMSMGNPFSFQQPGYQTGSPFGSMPSQFGGGLPRGYYT